MSLLRPGEFRITDRAMELCDLPKEAAVLDIGCGEGDTIFHLAKEYGYSMAGIDINLEKVRVAKEKNPDADIKFGDGEFLDDFPSFSFDCVTMECVLSLINMPDESLHEVYCTLKKGGKLVITDLYIREPEPGLLRALEIEVERHRAKPHVEGDCNDDCAEEHKARPVDFRSGGRFLADPLIRALSEIGFTNIHFEDFSAELGNYVAQKMMEDGNLGNCFCGPDVDMKDKKTGYFLLIAKKPL